MSLSDRPILVLKNVSGCRWERATVAPKHNPSTRPPVARSLPMPSMLSASLLVYLKPEEAQNYQLHRLETLGLGSTPRSSLACRSGSHGQDRALHFANHPVRFCVRNIACE